jgi:hypothetical protein
MRLRSTDISARTIGDETIVLNLKSSKYFTITGVGTRTFELLAEDTSSTSWSKPLLKSTRSRRKPPGADIEAFLDRLHHAKLLG